MEDAIVLAYGKGGGGEILDSCLDIKVAEVPQIIRLLVNIQRAGIKNIIVFFKKLDEKIKKLVENDKRINAKITWRNNGELDGIHCDRIMVAPSNVVVSYQALQEFIHQSSNGEYETTVLPPLGNFLKQNGRPSSLQDVGIIITSKSKVKELIGNPDLKKWLLTNGKRGDIKIINPGTGYCTKLNCNQASIKEAEELIFSTVGKTATGWIARNINGRISLPISKLLIKTPLTPNMISVLINLIGMLSGPFYAMGHPVIGAAFMQLATILDRCDGEVARIKLMETKKGQWVDTLSDQLTVLSFIIGVSVGYYLESKNTLALVLGGVNLFIFFFFLVWSLYFIAKFTDSGSLVAYFEVDKYVDPDETSFIRKVIAKLRPLGRRNVYSLAFLIFAIVGGYPLVLGVLTFALVLFLLHQIEDIIRIYRKKKRSR